MGWSLCNGSEVVRILFCAMWREMNKTRKTCVEEEIRYGSADNYVAEDGCHKLH